MKISSLTPEQYEIVQNNFSLKTYLRNLQVGRASTPHAWIYENKDPMEIVQSWIKNYLEPLRKDGTNGKLVYQYDTSRLKKCVPQGAVAPIKELMDIVTAGFNQGQSPRPEIYATREWQLAKEMSIKYLIKETGLYHSLTPRAYEHVVDDMRSRDTLESNSGWPLFSRRNKPEVLKSTFEDISTGKYKEFPAIILFRNYKGKTRMVWMYPMSTNIVEGSFTQPLKDAIMKSNLNFFAPWRGYDHVLNRITKLYDSGEFLSASDFSHTDEFFSRYDTLEVFDVIKHAFKPVYWNALKESMLRINSIPVVIGENKLISGWHGVSSGSNWTNDVETYYDFIFEVYFTIKKLVKEPAFAIGDDVAHRRDTYLKSLAADLAKEYKLANKDVNESKVTNERDYVIILQRLVIRGYYSKRSFTDVKGVPHTLLRGIYSSIWALWSSMMPEKFHAPKLMHKLGIRAKDMNASRLIMIAENLIDHPLFEDYVRFIAKGQPYLIEFAKKTDTELNQITEKSRLLPGFNPTYNQEKRDLGLSSFATIKLLRSL